MPPRFGIGAAFGRSIAYAKQRQAFGYDRRQPGDPVDAGRRRDRLEAARLLTKAAAGKIARNASRSGIDAKLSASEAAHKAADKAMQILASAGYRRGSVVERLFRDVRATEIYQGTSEAQRMIIAAGLLANV